VGPRSFGEVSPEPWHTLLKSEIVPDTIRIFARMAVYSCGRLLTQILEMRIISQFFSHQSSGTVRDRLPVAMSLPLLT
jgi:hypothetical protein